MSSLINSNQVNFQARKKILYQDATTVPMAKALGKKQLGIKEYTDFDCDSLEVINFINRGLVLAKNSSRANIRTPNYIDLAQLDHVQMSTKYYGAILTVNRDIYTESGLVDEIARMSKEMIKDGVIIHDENAYFLNEELSNNVADDFFDTLKINFNDDLLKLSYDEKLDLYHYLRVFYEQTSQLNRFPKDLIIKMFEAGCWGEYDEDISQMFFDELKSVSSDDNFKILFEFIKQFGKYQFDFQFDIFKYRTVFHELGHLQSLELFYQPDVSEYSSCDKYPKELKQWLNDKENLKVAFSVSPYACYGKGEFIAECYSRLLEGKELPAKALVLYKKLGGPKVLLR